MKGAATTTSGPFGPTTPAGSEVETIIQSGLWLHLIVRGYFRCSFAPEILETIFRRRVMEAWPGIHNMEVEEDPIYILHIEGTNKYHKTC